MSQAPTGQATNKLPMGVQGENEPGRNTNLTQKGIVQPDDATSKMPMGVQEPQADQPNSPPTPSNQPNGWNLRALPKPHTYREGGNCIVLVVASCHAALSSGSGGFAGQAASEMAGDFGLAGKPVIIGETNPFPVNPDTFAQMPSALKGCLWGKRITLTTRG